MIHLELHTWCEAAIVFAAVAWPAVGAGCTWWLVRELREHRKPRTRG